MKYLFAFLLGLLAIHGLIHLMGFAKAFRLGHISQQIEFQSNDSLSNRPAALLAT